MDRSVRGEVGGRAATKEVKYSNVVKWRNFMLAARSSKSGCANV